MQLDIELTERCNNDCHHCYINLSAGDPSAKGKEMTASEIKLVLEDAAALGCLTVKLTGGEPLLRDDFEEIYLDARKKGLRVALLTNGTLITPRLAGIFRKVPPLEKIVVSVYGLDEASYEAVSGVAGSYAAFKKGIDLMLRNDVPFELKSGILPLSRSAFREFENYAGEIPGMEAPQASALSLYLRCRDSEDKEIRNARIRGLRLPADRLLALEARRPARYADELRRFCLRFCAVPGDKLFGCAAGMQRASMDAYGNVKPCLLLRHPDVIYDLKSGSLKDAMEIFFPSIRRIKAKNPQYLERCAQCFLYSLCEQCPAVSWMENRRLDGWLEYFCEFTHAQARFIGLLKDGEKSWEVEDWENRLKKMSSKAVKTKNTR
jgi:radical SAM protein with 4Fe4S-binding SPASM domain